MTSITAQNLGSVAASADTTQANRGNQAQRQNLGTNTNPHQLIQQSQTISNTTSTKTLPDKNRSPQVPKKVEAGFSSQEKKEVNNDTRKSPPIIDKSEVSENTKQEGIDLIA